MKWLTEIIKDFYLKQWDKYDHAFWTSNVEDMDKFGKRIDKIDWLLKFLNEGISRE